MFCLKFKSLQFTNKGINYLNETEEQNLRDNFKDYLETDFTHSCLSYDKSSSQISQWLASRKSSNNKINDQLVLKCKPTVNPLANFAFIAELRNNFKSVWIQEIDNQFIVKIVDLKERIKLLDMAEEEEESVINKMIGFSLVFKCLVEARKPIVGHNMIMDLLLIYHHFYKPLPSKHLINFCFFKSLFFLFVILEKLNQFKSSLHSLFPYIFDTKCILFNERKVFFCVFCFYLF